MVIVYYICMYYHFLMFPIHFLSFCLLSTYLIPFRSVWFLGFTVAVIVAICENHLILTICVWTYEDIALLPVNFVYYMLFAVVIQFPSRQTQQAVNILRGRFVWVFAEGVV